MLLCDLGPHTASAASGAALRAVPRSALEMPLSLPPAPAPQCLWGTPPLQSGTIGPDQSVAITAHNILCLHCIMVSSDRDKEGLPETTTSSQNYNACQPRLGASLLCLYDTAPAQLQLRQCKYTDGQKLPTTLCKMSNQLICSNRGCRYNKQQPFGFQDAVSCDWHQVHVCTS